MQLTFCGVLLPSVQHYLHDMVLNLMSSASVVYLWLPRSLIIALSEHLRETIGCFVHAIVAQARDQTCM